MLVDRANIINNILTGIKITTTIILGVQVEIIIHGVQEGLEMVQIEEILKIPLEKQKIDLAILNLVADVTFQYL